MTRFVIEDSEWEATRKVDHLARDLYYALRRSMDFGSGIVGGPAKAISWWSLREDTETQGRPGVKAVKPSEQQLRRRMLQLEKAGLVVSIGSATRLKFRLPLAHTNLLDQKRGGTRSIGNESGRKAKSNKALVAYPQAGLRAKADTHPGSGKTLKPSPPNPPVPKHEGEQVVPPTPSARAGELDPQQQIEPPAPGAREDGKDCQPPSRSTRQRPSEERRRSASRRGDGPAARQLEKGRGKSLGWKPGCAWPIGLTAAERRDVAKMHDEVGRELGQRVFDELRGAMEAGTVHYPWGLMQHLFQRARDEPGWRPEHADRIAEQRARWRQTQEVLAAQEAAHAERWGLAPRPVAALTGDTWPAGEWPEVEP